MSVIGSTNIASLTTNINSYANAATLTNGTAAAGQKVVTVDSTSGFNAGAVSYNLVGGALETNTIDTIDSGTQFTFTTNIGSGGIADNAMIVQMTPVESKMAGGYAHAAARLDGIDAQPGRARLAAATAVGDTTLALRTAPDHALKGSHIYVGVGVGTVTFELRKATFSGATATLTALKTYTATTISFSSTGNKIEDTANSLARFDVGDKIVISGTANNNGTVTVASVVVDSSGLHITTTEALTTEAAGSSFTLAVNLMYTHAADDPVVVLEAPQCHIKWWGAYPGNTAATNVTAINRAARHAAHLNLPLIIDGGGNYAIDSGLFMGKKGDGDSQVDYVFQERGATITGAFATGAMWDETGVNIATRENIYLIGDATTPPDFGVQMARLDSKTSSNESTIRSAGNIVWVNAWITGAFDECAVLAHCTETDRWFGCWLQNTKDHDAGAGGTKASYCYYRTRENSAGYVSQFAAVMASVTTAERSTNTFSYFNGNFNYGTAGNTPHADSAVMYLGSCIGLTFDNVLIDNQTEDTLIRINQEVASYRPAHIVFRDGVWHATYSVGIELTYGTDVERLVVQRVRQNTTATGLIARDNGAGAGDCILYSPHLEMHKIDLSSGSANTIVNGGYIHADTYNDATANLNLAATSNGNVEADIIIDSGATLTLPVTRKTRVFYPDKGRTDVFQMGSEGVNITSVAGAGAGSGPTLTHSPKEEHAGKIQLATGTGAASGSMVDCTVNTAYAKAPAVILTAGNAATAAKDFYITSVTTTTWTVGMTSPADATTYIWYYQVIG